MEIFHQCGQTQIFGQMRQFEKDVVFQSGADVRRTRGQITEMVVMGEGKAVAFHRVFHLRANEGEEISSSTSGAFFYLDETFEESLQNLS